MILTFLVQLTRDVLASLPQLPVPSVNSYEIFYFCYIFVIGSITGIFLLYFGYQVRKQLTQFKDVDKDRKRVIKKVYFNINMIYLGLLLTYNILDELFGYYEQHCVDFGYDSCCWIRDRTFCARRKR